MKKGSQALPAAPEHVLYFSDMTHDREKELHHQLPSEKTPLSAAFCGHEL